MPQAIKKSILQRHRQSLRGRLRSYKLYSRHLRYVKSFYVYEPAGLASLTQVPVLYLFRGHEREWVNIREDSSRHSSTAIEDIDLLIERQTLPPLIVVMPGLTSNNNHIHSLGINMQGKWSPAQLGLGTGRFWDYLTRELFPWVEKKYRDTRSALRIASGFSLGGYTVSLLGAHYAGYFSHLGIYDGLFMWPQHNDPRQHPRKPFNDPIWCENPLFDAAFGQPRIKRTLRDWNPTDKLIQIDLATDHPAGVWWIMSAAGDGNKGNKDRTKHFITLLKEKGHSVGFQRMIFDQNASHSWHWTDRFLIYFLQRILT